MYAFLRLISRSALRCFFCSSNLRSRSACAAAISSARLNMIADLNAAWVSVIFCNLFFSTISCSHFAFVFTVINFCCSWKNFSSSTFRPSYACSINGTISSLLALSKWSMVLATFKSFFSICWRSEICSLMAVSIKILLSKVWPSSNLMEIFFPFFFSCSASNAKASSFSFSSISARMRFSSRWRDSTSRRLASAASWARCAANRLSSSSFSCSASRRSASSLRLSMITFLAKARLCSCSTALRIASAFSMRLRFIESKSEAAVVDGVNSRQASRSVVATRTR